MWRLRHKGSFLSFRFCRFSVCFFVSPSSFFVSISCFPWALVADSVIFCYFASVLHPPPAVCEPQVCVLALRAVFFLALLLLTFFFFHSLPCFSLIRFKTRFFHPVFFLWVQCCLLGFGFCCDSFSIWYDMIKHLDTHIRTLISPICFFVLRYTILFQLLCIIFCFICVPPEVIFRSRVIGACPVTTDCIVAII